MEQMELEPKRHKIRRLSSRELFQLGDWLRSNMGVLKAMKATRVTAAMMASKELGVSVRTSSIESAEDMIGVKISEKIKTFSRLKNSDVLPVLNDLKKRVEILEEVVIKLTTP